ncbi:MAG: Asp-tRNA(Asn)/Glu-tRNA(Gln) amidotransferase GatCAB subunit B, partial [Thermoleophilia bacterium]|nr:Asp-tRNA(Asn)/Glu-tRNA(Gln) amidotransferase GatCAB subunit B [Thermoleophilia bacterium]
SDEAELETLAARVVADHPAQAEQYRAGKQQVLGFFVGQAMKATEGRANPKLVSDLLHKALDR